MRRLKITNGIAKFNDNNCKQVIENYSQGLSITESFLTEIKRNNNNPKIINTIQSRKDKYYWIFKLLQTEQEYLRIQYEKSL